MSGNSASTFFCLDFHEFAFLFAIQNAISRMPQLTWHITGCSTGFDKEMVYDFLERGDKVISSTGGSATRLAYLKYAEADLVCYNKPIPSWAGLMSGSTIWAM